ncbi:MAG: cell wall hydrolase [Eubacteriales bacterium]|nr:cell wall hydrolase [Eubacteriales bacterium]
MNEQEKRQNLTAINRIEGKLDDSKKKQKEAHTALLFGLIIAVILLTLALCSLVGLSYIDKMQQDTLDTLMYIEQELDRASYTEELMEHEESIDTSAKVALNEQDRLLVAKICMAETNSYDGYMAVAQTIHDRSALWGQDVYDVATADKQFAAPFKGKANDEALQAVDAVFSGERAFGTNVTHFHSGQAPYWTNDKEYAGSRGGNHFYNSTY